MYENENNAWGLFVIAQQYVSQSKHLSEKEQEQLKIRQFERRYQYQDHVEEPARAKEKKTFRSLPKKALQSVFEH